MPRKTRSKKILAKLHRLEQSQTPVEEAAVQDEVTASPAAPVVSYQFKPSETVTKTATTIASHLDYSYVYKDLRKTLFFATAAVIFEVLLKVVFFK